MLHFLFRGATEPPILSKKMPRNQVQATYSRRCLDNSSSRRREEEVGESSVGWLADTSSRYAGPCSSGLEQGRFLVRVASLMYSCCCERCACVTPFSCLRNRYRGLSKCRRAVLFRILADFLHSIIEINPIPFHAQDLRADVSTSMLASNFRGSKLRSCLGRR